MNPFTKSNYPRIPGDYYPTIDPRCVGAFLQHFTPTGLCVDVCAPQGSGIVDLLNEHGYNARGLSDAFGLGLVADWTITNPPYKRPLVDDIIRYQIERIKYNEVYGLAVLLRSTFDHAKSRQCMFQNNSLYAGQIKMTFRPWWSEDKKSSPIHNFVWHIWGKWADGARVWYADGEKKSVGVEG